MNLDFNEMLVSSWKIGWNHKQLWLISMLPGIFVLLMFPLVVLVNPAFASFMPSPWNQAVTSPGLVAASVVAIVVLWLAAAILSGLARAVCMLGALEVDRGASRLQLSELVSSSLHYLWPILGLYLIFVAAWSVAIFILAGMASAISVLTLGLGSMCAIPLMLVLLPAVYLGFAVLEFAQAAILVDGLAVMEAIRKGFQLLRENLLAGVAVLVLQYFGSSLISGLIMLPLMLPLAGLAFAAIQSSQSGTPAPAALLILFPIALVLSIAVQGILTVFTQAIWAVTYRRLTKNRASGLHVPVFADERE